MDNVSEFVPRAWVSEFEFEFEFEILSEFQVCFRAHDVGFPNYSYTPHKTRPRPGSKVMGSGFCLAVGSGGSGFSVLLSSVGRPNRGDPDFHIASWDGPSQF